MTEICVQLFGELEEIKKAIIEKGYVFVESYNNFDTYYSTISSDEVKKVSYKQLLDHSIIVRNIVGDNCNIKNLTYKKKNLDEKGNVVNEVKTKLVIDDTSKAKTIFDNIGLTCWCDYVCQNNIYKKDEITINLQYVENLGCFLEIEEYKSISNLKDSEKFEILKNIALSLRFKIGKDFSVKKPYMMLF